MTGPDERVIANWLRDFSEDIVQIRSYTAAFFKEKSILPELVLNFWVTVRYWETFSYNENYQISSSDF